MQYQTLQKETKRVFTHAIEFVIWLVKGRGWTFNYGKIKEINPKT